jgi:hypothetical protein
MLSEANLAALLDLDEPLVALADAFGSLGAGRAPRSHRGSRSGPRPGCSAPCWSTAWGGARRQAGHRLPGQPRPRPAGPPGPARACSAPKTARRLPSWTAPASLRAHWRGGRGRRQCPRLPRRPRARDPGRRRAGPLAPGGPLRVRTSARSGSLPVGCSRRQWPERTRCAVAPTRGSRSSAPPGWPGAHVSSGAASGPSSTPRRRAPAGSWSSGAARS